MTHRDLVFASIQGMLRGLDPHSNFLTPTAYTTMRERQQGSFYGLGILVDLGPNKTPKKVEVYLPISASVDIYVANDRSLDGATKVGSAADAKGAVGITAKKPVPGQYVIVWFTEISKTGTGNDFRGVVGEISVSG